MRNYVVPLLFLLVFTYSLAAQNNTQANGARSMAMGNSGVASSDIWSATNNQAGLAVLENVEIAAFHQMRFGLSELSLSAVVAVFPTRYGNIGANVAYFGDSDYSETKIAASFAKRIFKNVYLAAQINYQTIRFSEGYQNASAVCGEVGFLAVLSKEINVGFHVFNPTYSALNLETKERIPTRYTIGVQYKPHEKIALAADAEKTIHEPIRAKIGIEYFFISTLCVRAGITTKPTMATLGAGYSYENFTFDLAFARHNILGNISSIGVLYKFKNRKGL